MGIFEQLLDELKDQKKIISEMSERVKRFAPPLTSKKEVAKFLGVTPRTINNYMMQGYLQDGYHYVHKNAKMIVFDEDAIVQFRDDLLSGRIGK